jgi:hypothetical protein
MQPPIMLKSEQIFVNEEYESVSEKDFSVSHKANAHPAGIERIFCPAL